MDSNDESILPDVTERPSVFQALLRRSGFRQLIKFCIVGTSSAVIDKGTLFLLTKKFAVLKTFPAIPWWFWIAVTFCMGVTNGFIWNRIWTFQAQGHGEARTQYGKFIITNVIGLLLNLGITKLFLMMFTGQVLHQSNPDENALLIANIAAIPFVVIWNFSAAKYWTFKKPAEE